MTAPLGEIAVMHRRPARHFTNLEPSAPPAPMETNEAPDPLLDKARHIADQARTLATLAGDAPVEDVLVRDLTHAIDRLENAMSARIGLAEARLEKLDTIVESLENVVDEKGSAAPGETPSETIRQLVMLAVADKLLSAEAAITAIARQLGIKGELRRKPDLLEDFASEASALLKRPPPPPPRKVSAPEEPPPAAKKKPGPKPGKAARKKPGPKPGAAKARAAAGLHAAVNGTGSPAEWVKRQKAAGVSQSQIAELSKLSLGTVWRFAKGESTTEATRKKLWAALERAERGK